MKIILTLLLTTLLVSCSTASLENPAETNQSIPNQELTLKVDGAVCGFCSYGIRKEISKLSFVDTSKYENGIRTNSEEQSVTISILPGKKVDEEVLRKIVIDAGYDTVSFEYND